MAFEGDETYNGNPPPVIVVQEENREIDAALEFEATEAIAREEEHEEVMTCLHSIQESSNQARDLIRSSAENQTENPLLMQVHQQQGEILNRLESLQKSYTESKQRSQLSNESPAPAPAPGSERTEDQTEEVPAEPPAAPPPPAKKRRFQTI